jgi:hypothetical protein
MAPAGFSAEIEIARDRLSSAKRIAYASRFEGARTYAQEE